MVRRDGEYQFPATNNRHNAQRPHSDACRIKLGRPPRIPKHDIRVPISIQVLYPVLRAKIILKVRFSLVRPIVAAPARGAVCAVAVYIHVGEGAAAGDPDELPVSAGTVFEVVSGSGEAAGEPAFEEFGTFASLSSCMSRQWL